MAAEEVTFAGGVLDRYRHVCAFVNDRDEVDAVLDPFIRLEEHRCEVHTWSDTYLRGGRFDQRAMLDLLDSMLLDPQSPRIRLVADMGWAIDRDDVMEDLIEFEARANFIHAQHEHVVICSYDVAKFDGAFIIDILRTHPMVLIGGVLQENPFFILPDELLRERSGDG